MRKPVRIAALARAIGAFASVMGAFASGIGACASTAMILQPVTPPNAPTSARSAAPAAAPAAAHTTAPTTTANFCAIVQQRLAGTALPVRNVVHTDYQAFVKSKPRVNPLEAHQFAQFEDASRSLPMRISCKTKTADHINAVYGSGHASDDSVSCRDINRATIMGVWSALAANERQRAAFPPWRVMLDGDDIHVMGSAYLKPYRFVYLGEDGLPHVLAKGLLARWDDWLWKLAPERFRGAHYCHLLAPEFARRLMQGQIDPAGVPER